jgi:hypothetical protein
MTFLVAQVDDERWSHFADVLVVTTPAPDAVAVAASVLRELPGCALVAVATWGQGCVLLPRGRPAVTLAGPLDVKAIAVFAYSVLVSGNSDSLDLTPSALGSSTPP